MLQSKIEDDSSSVSFSDDDEPPPQLDPLDIGNSTHQHCERSNRNLNTKDLIAISASLPPPMSVETPEGSSDGFSSKNGKIKFLIFS